MRPRQIAAVALVLGLTVAGFIVARVLAERDAKHGSERRIEIAAAQIRSRVEVATTLTDSLSRFMSDEGARGVTNTEFTRNASRWLSPADLPAAAWAQEVGAADRSAYERRIGRRIVAPDERRKSVPTSSSYLPATLISGFPPMNSPGIDLRRELGIPAALDSAIQPGGVGATPIAARRDGTRGLFLVAPAPNLIDGVLRPGAVVVFLSEATLRAAARNPAGLRFVPAGRSSGNRAGGDTVREGFTVAGQQFAVLMPKESVSGPGAVLPWILLAGGLVVAAFAAALAVNTARRAKAQQDFDRIFNLSPDLVAVANFDGYLTRVNPAAEQVLGYTDEELLARPYLDFVHPDDREKTAAEAADVGQGKTTLSFENRFFRKDGSLRVLEWTAAPVVEDGVMYGVARDVTDRRRAETESQRLADEQSALRRVAELVARHAAPERVFAAVTEQLSHLLGIDLIGAVRFEPDGSATVLAERGRTDDRTAPGTKVPLSGGGVLEAMFRTGRPVRIEDYAKVPGPFSAIVREEGVRCAVGGPIVVDGRLWGALVAGSQTAEALPPGSEDRVAQFAELVSTAISNIESRLQVERLAAEQSALRRVATLVAEGATPNRVFDAVRDEVEQMFGIPNTILMRFDPGDIATLLATPGKYLGPVGRQWPLEGDDSAVARVYRSGQAARADYTAGAQGPLAEAARLGGTLFPVAVPVVVDGAPWGAMSVGSRGPKPPPPDLESRLAKFTELLGTAIANAESRADLAASEARARELASEQAALRRVAELVAAQPPPEQVFALVTEELSGLLGADLMVVTARFEADGTATTLAGHGMPKYMAPTPGTNVPLPEGSVVGKVLRTGRPARVDDYSRVPGPLGDSVREQGVRAAVAGPIVVDGRLWGAMAVGSERSLPPGTEHRVAQFAELVSTAISNIESRAKVERLAAEQSALRRVATLVASEHSPDDLFATLVEEVRVLLGVDASEILRYEADATVTVVAAWSDAAISLPVGERLPLEGENLASEVKSTGVPGRKEDYSDAPGAIAALSREIGIRSAVATPIVVEGATWGMIAVASRRPDPLPADTEARLAEFSRVAGMAVANAKSRSDLAQSRARIVRAGDEARRRFERDLHDGAQQRLVSLGLELRAAETTVPPELHDLRRVLSHLGTGLADVLDGLRELSRGLHPAVLSEGGLRSALRSLARRSAVPVDLRLDLDAQRFEEPVEVAAYYVVSETLANTAKHAHASRAELRVRQRNGWLELIVSDDGRGGADASDGSGLTGLVDRVEAIGGTIRIDSSPDAGTAVHVRLPTSARHRAALQDGGRFPGSRKG